MFLWCQMGLDIVQVGIPWLLALTNVLLPLPEPLSNCISSYWSYGAGNALILPHLPTHTHIYTGRHTVLSSSLNTLANAIPPNWNIFLFTFNQTILPSPFFLQICYITTLILWTTEVGTRCLLYAILLQRIMDWGLKNEGNWLGARVWACFCPVLTASQMCDARQVTQSLQFSIFKPQESKIGLWVKL
jgi:hypothetical protein